MGAKLQALWIKIKQQWADIWDKDRGILVLALLLAAIVKFRDVIITILINSSKRLDKNAHKEDSDLANQENQLNQQANQAAQQAAEEPKKEQPVDDDWYKKGN